MPAHVVWAFAGVRALYDDGARKPQDVGATTPSPSTRPPQGAAADGLRRQAHHLSPPRRDVLARLAPFLRASQPWTAHAPLPGGDFRLDGLAALIERTRQRYPFLTDDHVRRLVGAYGTRVENILNRPPGSTISACASAPTLPPPRYAT